MSDEKDSPFENDDLFPKIPSYLSGKFLHTPIKYSAVQVQKKPMLNYEDIELTIVTDNSMTSDGYAQFDPQNNVFTCFLPSHVEVREVKMDVVAAYYVNQQKTIYSTFHDYPDVFSLVIDDSKKPCCVWFSPSAAQIVQGGEQVDHYPFDKASKQGSCFNPELTQSKNNFKPCAFSTNTIHQHSTCQFSTLSTWEDVSVAYADDVPQLTIQRTYNGPRIPSYRVIDNVNSQTLLDSTSDIEQVRILFDTAIENLDVVVVSPQKDKKSYFKAVLTS